MKRSDQNGTILLASLVLVLILTMLGFVAANKGQTNAKMMGSSERYSATFEAAEATLRRASYLVDKLKGKEPFYSNNVTGSGSRVSGLTNFNLNAIKDVDLSEQDPDKAFIWRACKVTGGDCSKNYLKKLDDHSFWEDAILTTFAGGSDVGENNYAKNIQTYTIIEELVGEKGTPFTTGYGSISPAATPGQVQFRRYLITVKASAFSPSATLKLNRSLDSSQSRENVVLQIIKTKVYNP